MGVALASGITTLSIHAASEPALNDPSFSYDHVSVCVPAVTGTATMGPHATSPEAPLVGSATELQLPPTALATPSTKNRKQSQPDSLETRRSNVTLPVLNVPMNWMRALCEFAIGFDFRLQSPWLALSVATLQPLAAPPGTVHPAGIAQAGGKPPSPQSATVIPRPSLHALVPLAFAALTNQLYELPAVNAVAGVAEHVPAAHAALL